MCRCWNRPEVEEAVSWQAGDSEGSRRHHAGPAPPLAAHVTYAGRPSREASSRTKPRVWSLLITGVDCPHEPPGQGLAPRLQQQDLVP